MTVALMKKLFDGGCIAAPKVDTFDESERSSVSEFLSSHSRPAVSSAGSSILDLAGAFGLSCKQAAGKLGAAVSRKLGGSSRTSRASYDCCSSTEDSPANRPDKTEKPQNSASDLHNDDCTVIVSITATASSASKASAADNTADDDQVSSISTDIISTYMAHNTSSTASHIASCTSSSSTNCSSRRRSSSTAAALVGSGMSNFNSRRRSSTSGALVGSGSSTISSRRSSTAGALVGSGMSNFSSPRISSSSSTSGACVGSPISNFSSTTRSSPRMSSSSSSSTFLDYSRSTLSISTRSSSNFSSPRISSSSSRSHAVAAPAARSQQRHSAPSAPRMLDGKLWRLAAERRAAERNERLAAAAIKARNAADVAQKEAAAATAAAIAANPMLFRRPRSIFGSSFTDLSTPELTERECELAVAAAKALEQQAAAKLKEFKYSPLVQNKEAAEKWLEKYNTGAFLHPMYFQYPCKGAAGFVGREGGDFKVMVLKGDPWGQDVWGAVTIPMP